MKLKLFVAAALLASLAVSSASAGVVYTLTPFSLTDASSFLTATGTITTDGNMGVLTIADITAVNIKISGGAPGSTITTSANLDAVAGNALTAVGTSLLFNFSDPTSSFLLFQSSLNGTILKYEATSTDGIVIEGDASNPPGMDNGFTGNDPIASAVPGPTYGTGLPGLIFALGGLFFWFRRTGRSVMIDSTAA